MHYRYACVFVLGFFETILIPVCYWNIYWHQFICKCICTNRKRSELWDSVKLMHLIHSYCSVGERLFFKAVADFSMSNSIFFRLVTRLIFDL